MLKSFAFRIYSQESESRPGVTGKRLITHELTVKVGQGSDSAKTFKICSKRRLPPPSSELELGLDLFNALRHPIHSN